MRDFMLYVAYMAYYTLYAALMLWLCMHMTICSYMFTYACTCLHHKVLDLSSRNTPEYEYGHVRMHNSHIYYTHMPIFIFWRILTAYI